MCATDGRRATLRPSAAAQVVLALLFCASVTSAQERRRDDASFGGASRSDLEAQAGLAVAAARAGDRSRDDADMILRRLREGDLAVGDRIVLSVPGVPTLSDTFVVRAGRLLEMPNIPPVPLMGVLRSELEHHLRVRLARFVHDTSLVQARSLMRLAIVGEVNRPGYYAVAPDALVGDVLMEAGGLTRTADAAKVLVRRGSEDIWPHQRLRDAVIEGRTLDQLNLRAGDEIVVAARRNWGEYVRTGALVGGVIVSVLIARR